MMRTFGIYLKYFIGIFKPKKLNISLSIKLNIFLKIENMYNILVKYLC